MTDVPNLFALSVVCMTTDALPSASRHRQASRSMMNFGTYSYLRVGRAALRGCDLRPNQCLR